MRCVSKCFIPNRPLRVYPVLLLGVIVGFGLSSILQGLNNGTIQQSADNLQKIVDYGELSRPRVAFSNLDNAEIDDDIFLGDYDYERMSQQVDVDERESPLDMEEKSQHDSMLDVPSVPSVLDSKLRQREYVNDNWQGRNVRETNDGQPLTKLSEELLTRQTLLVAVVTSVSQLMSQTLAIQGTWAVETAQVVYFIGEVQTMPHLPHGMLVVQLEGIDDKLAGWNVKEYHVVQYLIEHYLEKVDWFLLVGDETYVVSDALERQLDRLDAGVPVYMGRPSDSEEGEEKTQLCNPDSGIVYSRGLLDRLKPYLPLCWPGHGEMNSLGGCISVMALTCTRAKEVSQLHITTPHVNVYVHMYTPQINNVILPMYMIYAKSA